MRDSSKFVQGKFTPQNPHKYVGDVNNITFRSSWELSFFTRLDVNDNILEWGSEVVVVPYVKPTDGRVHRYFVDVIVRYKDRFGKIHVDLIEVKPKKQTKQPTTKGKSKKTQIIESVEWSINQAKWQAAQLYAKQRGWNFKILTEQELFIT